MPPPRRRIPPFPVHLHRLPPPEAHRRRILRLHCAPPPPQAPRPASETDAESRIGPPVGAPQDRHLGSGFGSGYELRRRRLRIRDEAEDRGVRGAAGGGEGAAEGMRRAAKGGGGGGEEAGEGRRGGQEDAGDARRDTAVDRNDRVR